MKRLLPALCVFILLSACAKPLGIIPIDYGPGSPRTASLPEAEASLKSAAPRRTKPNDSSVSPEPSPSPADAPPAEVPFAPDPPAPVENLDVDDVIQYAGEAVIGDDAPPIIDLAVTDTPPGQDDEPEQDDELIRFAHYIEENDGRYRAFLAAHPDFSVSLSLALVNVNADYGYYSGITEIENPADLLVLCNKNFQLPKAYVPEGLRGVAGSDHLLASAAADAFERMKQALKDELGLPLVPVSGYRSYTYQESLYARYAKADGAAVADTYSARAGHSEHQTGLTLDFAHKYPSNGLRQVHFENTAQYAWLLEHAHEYGFILRYPEGYEPITGYRFEPWHWRYIGADDASRMFGLGIVTFEEYIGISRVAPEEPDGGPKPFPPGSFVYAG